KPSRRGFRAFPDGGGRGRNRQGLRQVSDRGKRFILHVRQITPVVPPHQGGIQHAQQEQVAATHEKRLVVPVSARGVQRVARVKLNLLVNDLRPIKCVPVRAGTQFPPEPAFVLSVPQGGLKGLHVVVNAR